MLPSGVAVYQLHSSDKMSVIYYTAVSISVTTANGDVPNRPFSDSKAYLSLWDWRGSSTTWWMNSVVRENNPNRDHAVRSAGEGSLMPDVCHSPAAPAASEKYSSVHEVEPSPAGPGRHKESREMKNKNTCTLATDSKRLRFIYLE